MVAVTSGKGSGRGSGFALIGDEGKKLVNAAIEGFKTPVHIAPKLGHFVAKVAHIPFHSAEAVLDLLRSFVNDFVDEFQRHLFDCGADYVSHEVKCAISRCRMSMSKNPS